MLIILPLQLQDILKDLVRRGLQVFVDGKDLPNAFVAPSALVIQQLQSG